MIFLVRLPVRLLVILRVLLPVRLLRRWFGRFPVRFLMGFHVILLVRVPMKALFSEMVFKALSKIFTLLSVPVIVIVKLCIVGFLLIESKAEYNNLPF